MIKAKVAKRRRHIGLIALLLFVVLIAILFYDSNTRLVVDTFTISFDKLPRAFDGFRIVQLSDIHAARFGKDNSGLLDAVRKANPDIIAVTGDLINNDGGMDADLPVVRPLVQALVEIAPVYYVTGNHEWDSGWTGTLLQMLEDAGVTVLRNDYVRLTAGVSSIVLAGVDDPYGPADMKTPEELLPEIRAKEGDPFIILLEHRSNYLSRFSKLGIDLVLSGHAHGGQIRLPFVGGVFGTSGDFFPRYTAGVYQKRSTKMLVSRGIGNHTPLPRFLNNPEVVVAVLKTA